MCQIHNEACTINLLEIAPTIITSASLDMQRRVQISDQFLSNWTNSVISVNAARSKITSRHGAGPPQGDNDPAPAEDPTDGNVFTTSV